MRSIRLAAVGVVIVFGTIGYSARALHPEPAVNPVAAAERTQGEAPAEVPESITLRAAVDRISGCRGATDGRDCSAAAVYLSSPLMPLSVPGIPEVRRAAHRLGVELLVVDGSELEASVGELPHADPDRSDPPGTPAPEEAIRAEMIAAGATLHFPSLLLYRSGRLAGEAILGFKSSEAYHAMMQQRLREESLPSRPPVVGPVHQVMDTLTLSVDYPVSGRPGAYFKSVAGRRTIAFEAGGIVRLLDLTDGSTAVAPGYIDFVPTPDGRLFVTPAPQNRGLEFYDAAEVFTQARRGAGGRVQPIHVDRALRDQYPSVGILESDSTGDVTRTVYRVLTSWVDRIAFRDYEVTRSGARGRITVNPLGARQAACPQISIPILSPDGRHVAGRDEGAASTKIFRIGVRGECQEVADLRLQTGKVAWSRDGGRLAFAIPRGVVRDGSGPLWSGGGEGGMASIFVYDRRSGESRRVPGSEEANRLTFPDFVGADSLAFLLSPQSSRAPSVFRLVCCVR